MIEAKLGRLNATLLSFSLDKDKISQRGPFAKGVRKQRGK